MSPLSTHSDVPVTHPLRAVIFDYGLVLSRPAEPRAHAALLAITGLDSENFDHSYWKYRLAYDRGELNGRTYWETVARDANILLTSKQIEELIEQDIQQWATVNPVMRDWVRRVRHSGKKTAILSNMGPDLLAYMRNNFEWLRNFDHLTWSCELGVAKPERAVYEHALQGLGVKAEKALFIDDKQENVEGAQELGIHALRFRDVPSLEADLQERGWLSQLPPIAASPNEAVSHSL